MTKRDFDLNHEPLWFIPRSIQDRAVSSLDRSEYRNFLLCGLYCGMNCFFLLVFGIYSATIGEATHATVLFSLAAIILVGYISIWAGSWYALTRHFTTGMMAIMCLYLFYTGGLQNTGPLYYFVFPSVAMFLQGRLRGIIWVLVLLVLTLFVWTGLFGFDTDRYNNMFVSRMVGICLVISVLACIPEYFRTQAERNLLLSYSDLETLTYGDLSTKLANRSLLEKMLQLEYNRNLRYGSACCVMLVELDPVIGPLPGWKADIDNQRLLRVLAEILRHNLRVQDIAGRWEHNCFMLLLPEISLEGAQKLAERLLEEVRAPALLPGKYPVSLTASIGIAALNQEPIEQVLNRAAINLINAQRINGNNYVAY